MKWSIKIGRFFGIDVYLHATFLLLLAVIAFLDGNAGGSAAAALEGVVFFLALFLCVLLHEFGHALMARRYGVKTRDITLLPIGGLARLERIPEKPSQEFWVALAGPAVNVVIAAALAVALLAAGHGLPLTINSAQGPFLERLFVVNVMLVLFNMLPAFPMDGGRVLRAILAMRMNYARATRLAATIGKVMAALFAVAALFSSPLLLLIALFVWTGATQEASLAQLKASLAGVPARQAMMTDFRWLNAAERLADAADLLLAGWQQDFPVVDDGRLVGLLTRNDLLKALATAGPEALVRDAMNTTIECISEDEILDEAMFQHKIPETPVVHVVRDGRLVGLINMENVAEFLMIQNAVATSGRNLSPRTAPPPLPGFRPRTVTGNPPA